MNLAESIQNAKIRRQAPVIAEIKRLIPKLAAEEGRPKDERDAGSLARLYQEGGACGISLVAETVHFGGQPVVDIPAVLQNTSLPLLIKDFILDEATVDYYVDIVARSGAGNLGRVTLLLTAHRVGARLPALLRYVHGKGLLGLVETRTPADLACFGNSAERPRLVGLNNKDIDELETGQDVVKVTPELVGRYRALPGDFLFIGESAYRAPADVRRSLAAGVDAVLVGTAFMLAAQPAAAVASFVQAGDGVA